MKIYTSININILYIGSINRLPIELDRVDWRVLVT